MNCTRMKRLQIEYRWRRNGGCFWRNSDDCEVRTSFSSTENCYQSMNIVILHEKNIYFEGAGNTDEGSGDQFRIWIRCKVRYFLELRKFMKLFFYIYLLEVMEIEKWKWWRSGVRKFHQLLIFWVLGSEGKKEV